MNEKSDSLMMNPLVKRLRYIKNIESESTTCTYVGVFGKAMFFMLTVFIGVALALVINDIGPSFGRFNDIYAENGFRIILSNISLPGIVTLGIATLLFVITPFIAFLIRKALPVFGSLYCASVGYVIMFMANCIPDYRSPIILALMLTIGLVIAMVLLFQSGKVRASGKMYKFVMSVLLGSIITSLICFIGYFIPGLRSVIAYLQNNMTVIVVCGIVMIIVACLMLLMDFEAAREMVEGQTPKEFEWYAAFSISFSVIYLYLKILELLLKILGKAKK